VVNALNSAAKEAIQTNISISQATRDTASSTGISDWDRFAQEWRGTYMKFVRGLASDPDKPWKSVDQHHYDALKELLVEWKMEGLWSDDEILELSFIWHKLDPWKDSVKGLEQIAGKFKTATLSNGNVTLLNDLVDHGKLAFDRVFSCEEFKTYKPNPKTYLGAAEKLGFKPEECAMVAAHLFDLQAAQKCGLRTIYVARPREEEYDADKINDIRKSGIVDIWVEEAEDGFLTVAQHVGVDS